MRLITILLFVSVFVFGQSDDTSLTTQANVIRNETVAGGNTKGRIADMFQGLIDSKVSILAPRLTTTSTNGYVWTANGTTGLGHWQPSAGAVTSVGLSAGTTGTDINVSGSPITSSGTITLNIPDASATARGVITTGTQTIAGNKTFTGSNAYGTPASVTLTNATGLPISTGVSGLGAGVATWLGTPSWVNFNSMITGTAPFWSLSSGGTFTAQNNFDMAGYNAIFTNGNIIIGGATITANTKLEVRGANTTTDLIQRWSNSIDVMRMTINGQGDLALSGKLGITGTTLGTSADDNWLRVDGSFPSSGTHNKRGIKFSINSAGTASGTQVVMISELLAAYTGSAYTGAGNFNNLVAGTNTTTPGTAPGGNSGNRGTATATTSGTNIGLDGHAEGGNVNYGSISTASIAKNNAKNFGSVSIALNTGTGSATHTGVYGGLHADGTAPATVSAAGVFNNGTTTSDILILLDNSTTALRVIDGGRMITTAPVTLMGYTVATLPTGNTGDTAYVTDALAPTYLATVVGGGAIVTPVFFNGTNWVAH